MYDDYIIIVLFLSRIKYKGKQNKQQLQPLKNNKSFICVNL